MIDVITELNTALDGRYTIEREIGEGGMATVYLAADLRHDRKVALKVLKPELAAVVGADRFLAEIKTTANLQHPHILPLYDSGEAGRFLFYVMPFVEGETLRERLDRERQLPVDDAVAMTRTLAEALAFAHEKGVIHRDIKPANILIQAGKPVIADFGIALAVGAAGGGRLTETGLSVGTPHYMSPEQATGDPSVGVATDVYALACVLYEMLVGEPPYTGSSAQAVLGKILAGELTEATRVRPSVPVHVDSALRKGLEKLPADRFRSTAEFARALGDPGFRHGAAGPTESPAAARTWRVATVALAGTTLALAGVSYAAWQRPSPPAPVERFESPFRPDQIPGPNGIAAYALSPDGSLLVFRMGDDANQLWARRWDDPEALPIRGTAGAGSPAISGDGGRLAFESGVGVTVVALDGGPVTQLGPGFNPEWGDDGYVYWSSEEGGIVRASGAGGAPEPVTSDRRLYFVSDVLPGSRILLATVGESVNAISVSDGTVVPLVEGYQGRYVDSGHLVYMNEGTLLAARFDPAGPALLGPPVALMEPIVAYSLSDEGKLFYSRQGSRSNSRFMWLTREGQATAVDPDWTFNPGGVNPGWSLSPDGSRLAYRHTVGDNNDIWVKELPNGPNTRLTTSEGPDQSPRWSPDGTSIVYATGSSDACCDLWIRPADGTGEPRLLHDESASIVEGLWSADEEWLVMRIYPRGARGRDIVALRPGVDSVAQLLLTESYDEKQPALSPDGRWLAYTSTESGREEVFVRPFPEVDSGKRQISTDGGRMPLWAPAGDELFYIDDDDMAVVAAVDASSVDFDVLGRGPLFNADFLVNSSNMLWDISPDGQRFLVAQAVGPEREEARFVLVNNFATVLRERVPE